MISRRAFPTVLAGVLLVLAATPGTSEAIPAWARKYGSACSYCHYPNVPRLNSRGHRFRRAGFRMKGEMGKPQEITKVGDFLAVRARVRYSYSKPDVGPSDNEFQLNDVTVFYGGALSAHVSGFSEIEIEGESGEVEVLATAFGLYGDWDNFATCRIGQMHTLTRVGFGGLDRPTGISTPLVLSSRVTSSVGGIPFRLNEDQRGVEFTYVYGPGRVIGQILNGVDETGDGRGEGFDEDKDKDFVLAYEHILDELASGFTVFGYRGVEHLKFVDKNAIDEVEFYRYGATLAKVFESGFELQGGYVRGFDDVPNTLSGDPATTPPIAPKRGFDVTSEGAWAEMEYHISHLQLTPFGRFDFVNPKVGGKKTNQYQGTVGVAATYEDLVRPAIEAQVLDNRSKDTTDYKLVAELMINF
jgi:hypothetical protein